MLPFVSDVAGWFQFSKVIINMTNLEISGGNILHVGGSMAGLTVGKPSATSASSPIRSAGGMPMFISTSSAMIDGVMILGGKGSGGKKLGWSEELV